MGYAEHERNLSTVADTSTAPSDSIWATCPVEQIMAKPGVGYHFFDDFINYGAAISTETISGWYSYLDSGCTAVPTAVAGGEVAIAIDTDNEDAAIQSCGATGAPFVIPADSANGAKLWFEARVKTLAVTGTTQGCTFVGLAGPGAPANSLFADGGDDISDIDVLGFVVFEANSDSCDVICQKTSAAFDTIISGVDVVVADTYVKYGFVYDPDAVVTERIKFYVDGIVQSTYVGENSGDATVYIGDTTNFPGGENMAPLLAVKGGATATNTLTCDWIRCAQLR